jgi:F-type H+-transporting ATPase subunit gamma
VGENYRDIKKRIVGVQKTQKITSAMKMVSAAKLARATHAIESARPYAEKMRQVVGSVSRGVSGDAHPLLTPRARVKKLEIVVFTSDRGLCGAFNANIIKCAQALIDERRDGVDSISIVPVGRKGREHFTRRRREISRDWTGISAVTPEIAREIAQYLTRRYLDGEADEVILVGAEFVSVLTQRPQQHVLIPVEPEEVEESGEYEIEPSAESLLGLLIPQAVEFDVFRTMLENQAGEHGARMTAMDAATNNTNDLIASLTLEFNKARQAQITAELVEIVSGAEAL